MTTLPSLGIVLAFVLTGQDDPCVRPDTVAVVRESDVLINVLVNLKRVPIEFAQSARLKLATLPPAVLPKIALAMQNQPLRIVNWLRSAGDEIVDHALAESQPLPVDELKVIAANASLGASARKMAENWIERIDHDWKSEFLRDRLSDPVFGADAVAVVIDKAVTFRKDGNDKDASRLLTEAFTASKLPDQAEIIAKKLKELGRDVDLQAHLGIIRTWQVIGPFPGQNQAGAKQTFAPEEKVDLAATHSGKSGDVAWKKVTLSPGDVSLNLKQHVAETDDVIAYAAVTLVSETEREVELRGSGDDNLQVWLNGMKVIDSAEFHQRVRTDKHRARVTLQAGENQVLVKVCEIKVPPGPSSGSPARWQFALRVVDLDGKGIAVPTEPLE